MNEISVMISYIELKYNLFVRNDKKHNDTILLLLRI